MQNELNRSIASAVAPRRRALASLGPSIRDHARRVSGCGTRSRVTVPVDASTVSLSLAHVDASVSRVELHTPRAGLRPGALLLLGKMSSPGAPFGAPARCWVGRGPAVSTRARRHRGARLRQLAQACARRRVPHRDRDGAQAHPIGPSRRAQMSCVCIWMRGVRPSGASVGRRGERVGATTP
jgi:hypothetical protein